MSGLPETANLSTFAALIRRKKSYVSLLKATGRLVMTADGKQVRVAESIAMIEASMDPSKAAVAERHAAQREAAAGVVAASMPIAPPAASGDDEPIGTQGYAYWRERTEKAKAMAAERDNAIADSKLLPAAEVEAAVAAAATQLRASLEALPYDLAPELAPITDEAQLRARLVDAVEQALHELARQFSSIGRAAA